MNWSAPVRQWASRKARQSLKRESNQEMP
jgi:hypothetical protein